MSDPNKTCRRSKSCATCTVTGSSTTEKKNNVRKKLKLTGQNIRDMYSDLLAAEVRRRIRQKINDAAQEIDQVVDEALDSPDDLPATSAYVPPAPAPDFTNYPMTPVGGAVTAQSDY